MASTSRRSREVAWSIRSTTLARPSCTDAIFEILGNRGIYHKGWTAVTVPAIRHGHGEDRAPYGRRNLGALRRHTDWTRPTTWRRRCRTSSASCSGSSSSKRRSTTSCRWIHARAERADPNLAGLPLPIRDERAGAYGGMNRLSENPSSASRTSRLGDGRGRGACGGRRRGNRCPGRPIRRLGDIREEPQPGVLLQRARPAAVRRPRPSEPIPAGTRQVRDGVRLRRRRSRQGRRRQRSTTTASRSAKAASRRPSRSSSPPTRPPMSATRREPPSRPSTPDGRFTRHDQLGQARPWLGRARSPRATRSTP